MTKLLLTELKGSPLALDQSGFAELQSVLRQCLHSPSDNTTTPAAQGSAEGFSVASVPHRLRQSSPKRVQVLPITGLMTKYPTMDFFSFFPGMDDIAQQILEAETDDEVLGTVLLMNTYGGSTQSWIRMEEVLKSRKKPVIAVVDGMCASAGVYVACFCDRILALNRTCKIGSIGVMAQLLDTSEAEQKQGLRLLEFYPPESKLKNKAERDALDGNDKMLIEETLSPLARHFQQVVRTQRPNLKEEEGVLEGRMFFADDAQRLGLIDGICTLPEAMQTVQDLAQEMEEARSIDL